MVTLPAYSSNNDGPSLSSFFTLIFGVVVIMVISQLLRNRRKREQLRKMRERQTQGGSAPANRRTSRLTPGQLDFPSSALPTQNVRFISTDRPGQTFTVPSSTPASPRPATRSAPPKSVTLDLDPGAFTPLSQEQVRERAAAAGGTLASPWFGRRDLIPPITDPRTLLIDKAMVGHGLITPEELTEIHKVGEEMDLIRNQGAVAAQAAAEAVRVDQETRARIREEKKAAAAERKRLHGESVALRRRTDIIFLGRGVSRGLADRRANVEKLSAAGLPVLATPADVAGALGLAIPRLRWLAFHSEAATVSHYVRFTVPKRSGGTRQLSAPHRNLAAAQKWILEHILAKVPTHAAAHGFVPSRSTVTNAAPHVGRGIVLNADLADFFPTVTLPRVRGIFQMLGYSPAAATILALICTECPRREVIYAGRRFHVATGPRSLPQGACTSPALSNLAARRLDARLAGIAMRLGWTYTRYADDFTFSADGEASKKVGYLLARIRHITQDEGFTVNEKKTRFLRRKARQTVTGIVVNDRLGISRKTARRLRAILHRAKSEGLDAQNRQKIPHFSAHIGGMIAYIEMINPKQAAPLRAALQAVSA